MIFTMEHVDDWDNNKISGTDNFGDLQEAEEGGVKKTIS